MNTAYIYQWAWKLINDRRPEAILRHPPFVKVNKKAETTDNTNCTLRNETNAEAPVHTVYYKFSLSGALIVLLDLRNGCTGEVVLCTDDTIRKCHSEKKDNWKWIGYYTRQEEIIHNLRI